ncbi:MAG TPA: AtpZ/AtpI family protein [Magnetospirillum sp.]|jgi:ATP synthase protein I|nr:AtpZ/AtpI family protein [Magnetospirillum sp.]
MAEQEKPPSLEDIESRLRQARGAEDEAKGAGPDRSVASSGIGLGFRISIEFVAGVAVGVAIGYGLDRWLGTAPIMMVLFLLLGGAAGVLNAYRAAKGLDESVGLGESQRRRSGRTKE